MIFWLLIGIFVTATFNGIQKNKPLPPRYWYTEKDSEIRQAADSLLNSWAGMMKQDTLWYDSL